MLTDNPWDGGGGYTANQVGDMTLDQIYMRLADKAVLKMPGQKRRTYKTKAGEVPIGSPVKGRTADGKAITAQMRGKSRCRELMEQEAAKQALQTKKKKRRRRK